MFSTSGHMEPDFAKLDTAYVDLDRELVVSSCGHTRMITKVALPLTRPNGRPDYQLIYIAKGTGEFCFFENTVQLHDGQIIVYLPGQRQQYRYFLKGETEVFWIHFTGYHAGEILSSLGLLPKQIHTVGVTDKYAVMFEWIIRELQLKRYDYSEIANGYFKQILHLMSRNSSGLLADSKYDVHLSEKAIVYFHQHYGEPICIKEYARSCNVSVCWFLRSFKRYTGQSPLQYLNDIRIKQAKELLVYSSGKVNEIAAQTGFENPLYFSRIFKKNTGYSPLEYRKKLRESM